MSLQNKNNQFLGTQDNVSGTDDVVDIFDQYGSDDLSPVSQGGVQNAPSVTPALGNDVSMPVDDDEEGEKDEYMSPSPVIGSDTEKKWEATYADGHMSDVSIEHNTTNHNQMEVDTQYIVEQESAQHQDDPSLSAAQHPETTPATQPFVHKVAAPMKENINTVMHHVTQKVKEGTVANAQKAPSQQHFKIDPGKKTIAIVDDDIDTLDMYTSIFEAADYNVIRASDGLEALSVIGDHTPHVIFTGIIMPHMDGFAMMEALKQNKRTADIPVVINSHLGREADRKRAEELGAKDFIVRGFTSPREALERISALLLRSEYTFHFDANDPEARKLVKDLGAHNFFVCPRGQEMVLKLRITDPKELTFSARFSCMDQEKRTS